MNTRMGNGVLQTPTRAGKGAHGDPIERICILFSFCIATVGPSETSGLACLYVRTHGENGSAGEEQNPSVREDK